MARATTWMERIESPPNSKKLSLKTFAFPVFFYAIYYIVNAGAISEIFNPFPGRIVIVYITAFVDFVIASSILANAM